ncbi:LacI family DNA-binding transcriptional regulator [Micromonospora sp. DT81.3]|uniref:LacI family DNA-binding transcriptional regulator n=1 Tax=Micromonospora sp. DT81.3 TaxID=3416523 RepID=UPI003CEFE711
MTKRTGIRDVAREAGVSISTVSKALNRPDGVNPQLVARVRLAADELGYVPLEAARQLRVRRSGLLGMTVINIANPFFAELMAGAEDAVAVAGLRVLVGNSDDDVTKERDHLELFERVQVEGALVTPFGDTGPWIDRLRARGIPVVLVDTMDDSGALPSVSLDDIAGGRMAAGHLIDIGRRRLAFLGAREEVRQVRERLQGAREAVAQHPEVTLDVTWCERTTARVGQQLGARIAALDAAERPDGIITTNDHMGCGVVHGLVSAGVRVPEDIAVIGYDDIEFASIAAVPLSSIRQPAREMGKRAGELLLRHIAGDLDGVTQVVFQPELVIRASTVG